jgi:uncharacterized protein YcfJ
MIAAVLRCGHAGAATLSTEDSMRKTLHTMVATVGLAALALAAQAAAQVTLYENENFSGRTFSADGVVPNLGDTDFNDRASSMMVSGSEWQVCQDANFSGQCVVLRPGQYASLREFGLARKISSLRPVGAPVAYGYGNGAPPPPAYDYRRRGGEALYEAPVSEVRAVVGPPEQRCWVERQQVETRGQPNVPGAIVGAVIGGVLGHQIGSGRGNSVATAGGAVAGAAIGANVNRGSGDAYTQDVQRCQTVASNAAPAYWDVTYTFNGQYHRVQMASPPGATITVNGDGEPRV